MTTTTASAAEQHADASASNATGSCEQELTSSAQLDAIRRREAEEVCTVRARLVEAVCNSRINKLTTSQQGQLDQGQLDHGQLDQRQLDQRQLAEGQSHAGSLGAAALGARRPDFDYYMSVIVKTPVQLQQSGSFVAVGINISDDFTESNETQRKKNLKYLRIMKSMPARHLSSAARFTLLRLCAFPKVIFYASTTPPEHAAEVIKEFQAALIEQLTELLGVVWTDANYEALFQRQGCGLPDLVRKSGDLYADALMRYKHNNYKRANSLSDLSGCLAHTFDDITSPDLRIHLARQNSAAWLFTALRGDKNQALSNHEFTLNMAVRCNALPVRFSFAAKDVHGNKINRKFQCDKCQETIDNDQKYIAHLFSSCSASSGNYVRRHNRLRDQIASVMRTYGVSVETEPTMFSNSYADGKANRPDLLVVQAAMSATDFSIANTTKSGDDKSEVRVSANLKRRKHYNACNKHDTNFYPYVVSIHGWLDHGCWRFIHHVATQMAFELRDEFIFNVLQTTSLSLAKSRADMISNNFVSMQSVSIKRNNENTDGEKGLEEQEEEAQETWETQSGDGEYERNTTNNNDRNPDSDADQAEEAGEKSRM